MLAIPVTPNVFDIDLSLCSALDFHFADMKEVFGVLVQLWQVTCGLQPDYTLCGGKGLS
jgi:hypothetical protein